MHMSLDAANPHINATVTASAGSGKTYMLVTRILRLLLADADPGTILALTFTRKAAAEMQQRLAERLYELATVDDNKLQKLLGELDLDSSYADKARRLYDAHQYCDYPVRTLTFHSFCQDLLARFPLEAEIPPNFDLLESSDLLIQQARDALFNDATLDMQGELSQQLQRLMQLAGGLFNLDRVLYSFLHQRSDWWAFTDGHAHPVEYAKSQLANTLNYQADNDPLAAFFNDHLIKTLQTFAQLLAEAEGKKNLECADNLANWLVDKAIDKNSFEIIRACFLTLKNEPMSQGRKDTKALRKKLGDDKADEFLEIHQRISEKILDTLDQLNKQNTWDLNSCWYYCGEKFVEHYQLLKQQQRLLDFTDLEWQSYKLLQDSDNAQWIQYKLDQRIQHLLIDEFQDTNPTQWQLILPLLEEMAAAESERERSVFLVGDEKQSIYSFRRAKPELQQQASNWLAEHLDAKAFPLNKSWRSSPAIIKTVNAVFQQEEFLQKLPSFSEHQTNLESLPGRVETLPLWSADEQDESSDAEDIYCRYPLKQPRPEATGIHQKEARQIAQHIQSLISDKTAVMENGEPRSMNYNDIYILVRKRAHVADYERALRGAGIAYLGTNRGTFLSCLEIQDMEALLNTLLTPFNNLALAQVLKSPLFSATDDDLQLIARHSSQSHWYDRLAEIAPDLDDLHPVSRAWNHLGYWRTLADKIPVHDLLDKIFADADVLERYHRATPAALQPRVSANLTLFLEMALDLDSGRYPSLMHFLYYLRSLKTTQSDAPDEAPMETREPRVKIMTIHASKGLEAPVVYLADTINVEKDRSSLSTLIDWPVEDKKPRNFQLIPSSKQIDNVTKYFCEEHKISQQKEDANLLYVALTRARQYLFLSGCRPSRGQFINWYDPVFKALQSLTGNTEDQHLVFSHGEQISCDESLPDTQAAAPVEASITIDSALTRKITSTATPDFLIAPSKADAYNSQKQDATYREHLDEDAQQRGVAIHRMLELLCSNEALSEEEIIKSVSFDLRLEDQQQLKNWLSLAQKNLNHSDLQLVFSPQNNLKTYNECPIQYTNNNQQVFGVIDRLLVNNDKAVIVDYKTHHYATKDNVKELSEAYLQQMQLYADGVKQLWPELNVEAYLLFTECHCLQAVNIK